MRPISKKWMLYSLLGISAVAIFLFWPRPIAINNMPEISISNVTQEQTLVLSDNSGGNVHMVAVVIKGYIDGKATICLYEDDGRIFREHRIKGRVYREMGGEYYSSKLKLKYAPTNVKSGNLHIFYKFYTI